jgi:hypothetical protein
VLYLLRITPANWLYAWWVSLRCPVGAWKIELPAWLADRFTLLRPYEVFTRDEWMLLHEDCLDAWRARILPALMVKHRCTAVLGGMEIDFSRHLWQILAVEFERLWLFIASVRRSGAGAQRAVVPPWIALALGPQMLKAEFPDIEFRHSWIHMLCERAYEWAVSAAHVARTCLQLGANLLQTRLATGPRRILWTGISPQEIPSAPDQLHYGWAAAYGPVAPAEVLYFPPLAPNAAQSAFLAAQSIVSVAPAAAGRLIPWSARLQALGAALAACLRGLFADSAVVGPLRARFMARAPLWQAIVRALGARLYITSTSYSWPEKPEVAVLPPEGVRSVIWSYSANTLWFARSTSNFRDTNLVRCIVVSDEFWVWNDAVRRYYERRRASEALPFPRIEVTGPMMCGDIRHLELTPAVARRRLGLPKDGYCLSVFDVPTVDEAWRHKFGGGPVSIELDFAEAFFDGIREVLDALPDVRVILKLKRQLGERYRRFPQSMLNLIAPDGRWMREQRVLLVDVNCDPYLPVAAGDASLGMPCTSPVLAALSAGRPAAYYDPLGILAYSPEAGLAALRIGSTSALLAQVATWQTDHHTIPAQEALAPPPAWRTNAQLFVSN